VSQWQFIFNTPLTSWSVRTARNGSDNRYRALTGPRSFELPGSNVVDEPSIRGDSEHIPNKNQNRKLFCSDSFALPTFLQERMARDRETNPLQEIRRETAKEELPLFVMDARVYINLLGELRVSFGDGREPLTRFRTQKAAALLAYMALHPRQNHGREVLLELFWPDKDEATGRDNLSTALAQLRRQLEPGGSGTGGLLVADRQTVRLHPAAFTTDVMAFEKGLEEANRVPDPAAKAALLGEAVSLYKGELLPSFYDDWALREQGRLAGRYADALEQWGMALERADDIAGAIAALRRCVAADPLREEAYRSLMRLLCATQGPAAAKSVYQELTRYMREQMDAAPSLETRRLFERIERAPESFATGDAEPPISEVAAQSGAETAPSHTPHDTPTAPQTVRLPLYLTRFVGRESERAQLGDLLAGAEATRLLTLLGPGGAGKTRLAAETAAGVSGSFPGGVWFVSLADIPAPAFLPPAIASTLGLPPGGQGGDPLQRICDFLSADDLPKLLILDNFEHLLAPRFESEGAKAENPALRGASALVRLLLARTPCLSCLVTSRQVLGLGGEREYLLQPLPVPGEGPKAPADLLACSGVALFVERARAVVPDFALNASNADAVSDICRLMEGVPLAIEMAAAWTRTFPPARMRERLAQKVTALPSRRRDLPPRHQSLFAAAEWSYQLLEPDQGALLRRLSVFRGGWSLEQAEAFSGNADALTLLTDLQDRSLITVTESPHGNVRYRLLEPLREFGAEKMAEQGEAEEWQRRHADLFATFVWEAGPHLDGAEQAKWLADLAENHDNIRVALEYHLDRNRPPEEQEAGLKMCSALYRYWSIRGHLREGYNWCNRALTETSGLPPTPARASVCNANGHLATLQGDFAEAHARFEEARDIWEALGERSGVAVALGGLGNLALRRGDPVSGRRYHEQALMILRELDKPYGIAITLGRIARAILSTDGDLNEVKALQEESLAILRRLGNQASIALTLNNIAGTVLEMGDPNAARIYLEEATALNRDLHNEDGEAYNLCGLGQIEIRQKNYALAREKLVAALRLWDRTGNVVGTATVLESLAQADVAEDHGERAARLIGAADAVRGRSGETARDTEEEAAYADSVTAASTMLGTSRFEAFRESGRGLTLEQAVALVSEG
jgi:predicted ATPase/DNA-binding SARP family transcriptional activator